MSDQGSTAFATLEWSNPKGIDLELNPRLLYFISVKDPSSGQEYRYIGQTSRGRKRLREYVRNVKRIESKWPRRTTPGQEAYRPVHLAIAKACQYGWLYDFYPIEIGTEDLNQAERELQRELGCNLNVKCSWLVEEYDFLSVDELLSRV